MAFLRTYRQTSTANDLRIPFWGAVRSCALAAVLLFSAGHGYADGGAGTGAADFLKIPVGARGASLGGAFTAVADNSDAVFYNPAGLNLLTSREASFSQNNFVEGVSQQWLAGAYPWKTGVFGLGVNYLSVSPFASYDAADNRTGSVSADSLALHFAWGGGAKVNHKYVRSVSYGAALKVITEKLDTERGSGYALDLGVLADSWVENLRFGLKVENAVSSKIKFIEKGARPPLAFKTGVTYAARSVLGPIVRGSLDYGLWTDWRGYLAAGLEGVFSDIYSLRVGYSSFGDISNGLSFGLGAELLGLTGRNIIVDYSFSPTYSFGDIHKLSVRYKFGPRRVTAESVAAKKREADIDLGPSSLPPAETPSSYYLDIFNTGSLVQKRNAIMELGQRGGDDSLKFLIGILKDTDPWVVRDSVAVLAKLNDSRIIDPVIELLKSENDYIRLSAISGLARYREPKVFAAIAGCLQDKSPEVRAWAAEVLGNWNSLEAIEPLQAALKTEQDGKVRDAIAAALRKLDPSIGK